MTLCLFLALSYSTQAEDAPKKLYRECLSTRRSKLIEVELVGCTKLPCKMWPGKVVALNITFVPADDINTGTLFIKGKLM